MDLVTGTIQLTSEYTNALLVAILPFISDFTERAKLDIPRPVTTTQVAGFGPYRRVGPDRSVPGQVLFSSGIGGRVLLTNGMVFNFDRGQIDLFESALAFEQKVRRKPILANNIKIDRDQAVRIARQKIQELGYGLEDVYADLVPNVREPERQNGRTNALYIIQWNKPNYKDRLSIEAWVNGESGALEYIWLLGAPTRPAPKLKVSPFIQRDVGAPVDVSDAEKEKLCEQLLPDINWLASKLELPISRPIVRESIANITAYRDKAGTRGIFVLTNGYSFETDRVGYISGYAAPDVFFGNPHVVVRDTIGKWNLNKSAAVKLALATVKKLGFSEDTVSLAERPEVTQPYLNGPPIVPRYSITWTGAIPNRESYVNVEVDAEKGRITALNFKSKRLQRLNSEK